MDLSLKDKLFIVGGATSGFGKAVAEKLIEEGAIVIATARTQEKLSKLADHYPGRFEGHVLDMTQPDTIEALSNAVGDRTLSGILVNAGGPPAGSFIDSTMDQWDEAYRNVLRWKVAITKKFLPHFIDKNYGRIVYVESVSVKQFVPNLVLSNSLRMGVVGFVKTLANEVADKGITLNVLAPGYHATPAMDRLFVKKSQITGVTPEQARIEFESEIPMEKMGDPKDFASIAVWLLSENSRYITGQTISVDGGLVQGNFG